MTGYQAAMGRVQLAKIERILAEKRRVAATYTRALAERAGDHDAGRGAVGEARLLDVRDPRRGRLRADAATSSPPRSRERGVESRTFFCPMNLQPFLRDQPGFRDVPCPVAEELWQRGLYLPSSPSLSDEDVADDRLPRRRAGRRPLVNSYTGLHARVYDEIYATKPYAEEARFVHELAGAPGGKLLDVACGTGRHALAFADLGYDVTATDLNEELLAVGRASAGDRVRFVQGDMTDLDVPGGPFDLVTCLFDSIGYAQANDRVVAALRSLGRHAAEDGTIVSSSCTRPRSCAEPTRGASAPSRCPTAAS